MKTLEEQVLPNDIIHAKNCLQGYEFYKDRDSYWAKQYLDTLQDLKDRKEIVADLEREERLLENAIWMMDHGQLGDICHLPVIDALIRATVRLKSVRFAKYLVTGFKGDLRPNQLRR